MTTQTTPEIQAAIDAFERLNRVVLQRPTDWTALELTMAQAKALLVLVDDPGLTIGALADHLGVKPPAASLLVERMVQAGLLARHDDEHDRRRVVLTPTETARDLIGRLRGQSTAHLRELLAGLAAGDLQALTTGIEALARVAATRRAQEESTTWPS
jgi:DNA-binding MarR family transcriptional regulator